MWHIDQEHEYRGWRLTLYTGRAWIGCAARQRPPHQVFLVKGSADSPVLAALRSKVDEIEDEFAGSETSPR
jgi:hypothetical protein